MYTATLVWTAEKIAITAGDVDGYVRGSHVCTGARPAFTPRAMMTSPSATAPGPPPAAMPASSAMFTEPTEP